MKVTKQALRVMREFVIETGKTASPSLQTVLFGRELSKAERRVIFNPRIGVGEQWIRLKAQGLA